MVALSVVVIIRNQAWNVARLLESVLQETRDIASECILVDSASTDGTTDAASRYPVEVLRLSADQPLTAGAGRHVGLDRTHGELVLFLDGDMELCQGWLDEGRRVLASQPETAAVTGDLLERPEDAERRGTRGPATQRGEAAVEVRFAAGAGLYRRAVLDRVGDFNPFLRSDEEPELGVRIRRAGYRIVRTERPIAYHYSAPSGSVATVIRRWRRGLFLGSGQNLRYHLGSPLFWPYLRERGFGIPPLMLGLTGITTAALSSGARRRNLSAVLLAALLAVLAAHLVYRRDPRRTAHAVLQRLLIADGTVRGFLMAPRPPESYPGRFEVVRSAEGDQA